MGRGSRKARHERRRKEAEIQRAAEEAARPEKPAESNGGAAEAQQDRVGGAPSPMEVKSAVLDNAIVKLAIEHRWPVSRRHKEAALGIISRNMAYENGVVSNGAVANLIRIEAQNQADEQHADKMAAPASGTNVNVNVGVAVQVESQLRQELLSDIDGLRILHEQALSEDSKPIIVASGKPSSNGHSTNGHSGNGHSSNGHH